MRRIRPGILSRCPFAVPLLITPGIFRLQLDTDATMHLQEVQREHENRLRDLNIQIEEEKMKLGELQAQK